MSKQDQRRAPPGLPPDSPYVTAIREAKAYATRIRDNPAACPMFPNINRSDGAAETLCYMQGYLAARIAHAGARPTREQMRAIRHDVMHDDAVREIVVGMQDTTLFLPDERPW